MQAHLEQLAARAFDSLPQPALIVDRQGQVLARNMAAEAVLPPGGDISQMLAKGESLPALDWAREMAALDAQADGLTLRNVSLLGRGGRVLLTDIALCRLEVKGDPAAKAPEGASSGADSRPVLAVIEDISPRVAMERRLAASERLAAMGELAAKVAHELNNPLDAILRYIGLAQRLADKRGGEYLQRAREGLMRMAAIVRDLLEQGSLGRGREKATIEKLLSEAVTAFKPMAQANGVAIRSDLGPEADWLVEGACFQVFCNVIKNAIDAMDGGGLLTIRSRPADGECVVEFADTGCGIAEQDIERIFEPFYTTKPPGQGAGLGLAICREILARFGGRIEAAPRRGGGAVFTVRLPVGEPAARKWMG